jgi:RimJ/RimL family protein N-acetyltransferase
MRPFEISLKNGRRVRLQPVRPEDRARLAAAFASLSPRSRFLRFRRQVTGLSAEELAQLTATDGRYHIAWGAIALDEPGEPGVGVARLVRHPDDSSEADCAVTVVDAWQRQGLGRVLAETLMLAALERGITTLHARLLPENVAARRLFGGLGGRDLRREGSDLLCTLPVRRDDRTLASSAEFRDVPDFITMGATPRVSRIRALLRLL